MNQLPRHPHIYEINLMTWLYELSQREGRGITLKDIPSSEWTRLKKLGIDLVWLMGVWQRSAHSKETARREAGLLEAGRSILADFRSEDIDGSPYAVKSYVPDPEFGSEKDLAFLGKALEEAGLSLILDFVPNHTACDHPWIEGNPDIYIHTSSDGEGKCKEGFFLNERGPGKLCIAHGKDPYFPPWTDTAQLDYSNPQTVEALLRTLSLIADYCHGFRCDMAMLVLRDVFRGTWQQYLREGAMDEEFWSRATRVSGSAGKRCLWIAEAYWGKEQALLDLGFDYAYDKTLYDLLTQGNIQGLKQSLSSPVADQERRVRFLENHDEPRAMAVFGPEKIRSAMVIHATLPGMRFWHQGQLEGRRIKVPVQLRRSPKEERWAELEAFSEALLIEVKHPVFHDGDWEMCETGGWPDNQSHRNLLAWSWREGRERRLIVVNFSSSSAQGYVKFRAAWLPAGNHCLFVDPLKQEEFPRSLAELENSGLYVELGNNDFHFFRVKEG